jgi:hypothetical protein
VQNNRDSEEFCLPLKCKNFLPHVHYNFGKITISVNTLGSSNMYHFFNSILFNQVVGTIFCMKIPKFKCCCLLQLILRMADLGNDYRMGLIRDAGDYDLTRKCKSLNFDQI